MARFIDDYLLYLLAQASSQASAEFHTQLARQGIAVSTWRILASLYPDGSASLGELAQTCLTKQPTMTRQIDRLTQAGLVKRQGDDGDRRRVRIQLTPDGRALADRLTQDAKRHESQILAELPSDATTKLKSMLSELTPD